MYKKFFKRFFDFIIALCALPFILIISIFVYIAILLDDKGPLFYLAPRRGKNGKIFKMLKFRSMKVNAPDIRNADNSTYNAPDDPRITRVGKFLRKSSIDEIPQLWNVLIGEMSIIGPRPTTINRPLEDYDGKRWKRLEVSPGITGYSQAYFRNSISNEEKLEKDAWYAKNLSFILDLKIVGKTIHTVLFGSNIYNVKND